MVRAQLEATRRTKGELQKKLEVARGKEANDRHSTAAATCDLRAVPDVSRLEPGASHPVTLMQQRCAARSHHSHIALTSWSHRGHVAVTPLVYHSQGERGRMTVT